MNNDNTHNIHPLTHTHTHVQAHTYIFTDTHTHTHTYTYTQIHIKDCKAVTTCHPHQIRHGRRHDVTPAPLPSHRRCSCHGYVLIVCGVRFSGDGRSILRRRAFDFPETDLGLGLGRFSGDRLTVGLVLGLGLGRFSGDGLYIDRILYRYLYIKPRNIFLNPYIA